MFQIAVWICFRLHFETFLLRPIWVITFSGNIRIGD